MDSQERLLQDIGIVDFTLIELTLYLDTHPYDCNAIDYFNHYNKMKKQMTAEFAQRYFPLTVDMVNCSKEWSWGMAPLPWEGVCK